MEIGVSALTTTVSTAGQGTAPKFLAQETNLAERDLRLRTTRWCKSLISYFDPAETNPDDHSSNFSKYLVSDEKKKEEEEEEKNRGKKGGKRRKKKKKPKTPKEA